MKTNGKEGEYVSSKVAEEKCKKHQKIRNIKFEDKSPKISEFYGKEKLMELLNKPGAMGLRFFFASDDGFHPRLVIAAADSNLNLIVKDVSGLKDGNDGDYLSNGPQCPDFCGGQ